MRTSMMWAARCVWWVSTAALCALIMVGVACGDGEVVSTSGNGGGPSCNAGYASCDANAASGCETPLGTTANCAGCGDDRSAIPGFSCSGTPAACQPVCGDGIVAPGEQCDDGNTVPTDGCDAGCATEMGWVRIGEPSNCFTSGGTTTWDPAKKAASPQAPSMPTAT